MRVSAKDKRIKALNALAPTAQAKVKGLQDHEAEKIRNIVTVLRAATDLTMACTAHPEWRCHQHKGKVTPWSIDVQGSTRMLFEYNTKTHEITGLRYDDPH